LCQRRDAFSINNCLAINSNRFVRNQKVTASRDDTSGLGQIFSAACKARFGRGVCSTAGAVPFVQSFYSPEERASGAKALICGSVTARLKSCPDTKRQSGDSEKVVVLTRTLKASIAVDLCVERLPEQSRTLASTSELFPRDMEIPHATFVTEKELTRQAQHWKAEMQAWSMDSRRRRGPAGPGGGR
jgi:hypothetical protein